MTVPWRRQGEGYGIGGKAAGEAQDTSQPLSLSTETHTQSRGRQSALMPGKQVWNLRIRLVGQGPASPMPWELLRPSARAEAQRAWSAACPGQAHSRPPDCSFRLMTCRELRSGDGHRVRGHKPLSAQLGQAHCLVGGGRGMGVAGVAGVPAAVVMAEAVRKGGIQMQQRRGKGERGGNRARAVGVGPAPRDREVCILSPARALLACVTWGGHLCSGPARLSVRGGGESSCDPKAPASSRAITFSFLEGPSPTAATATRRGQAGADGKAVLMGSPKWRSTQPARPPSLHLLPAEPPRTRRLMEESPPMPITVLQQLLRAPPLCWQQAVSSEGK